MFRFEGKRCVRSWGVKGAVLLAVLLAGGHFLGYCVWFLVREQGGIISREDREILEQGAAYIGIYPATLYEGFIGGEGYTFFNQLYYYMIPILAVLPYGASFFQDEDSGYLKYIYSMKKKSRYLLAKYAVTFLSGAVAAALPYALSFAVNALYVPAVIPNEMAQHTNVIDVMSMSEFYYSRPWIYFGVYMAAIMLCGGLLASLALCITYVAKNFFFVLCFPFLFYISIDYILMELGADQYSLSRIINPMNGYVKLHVPIQHVFLELLLLGSISFLVFIAVGIRRERVL